MGFHITLILDILDFTVKADESVLPYTTVEASDFPVDMRSPDTQVSIVSSLSS